MAFTLQSLLRSEEERNRLVVGNKDLSAAVIDHVSPRIVVVVIDDGITFVILFRRRKRERGGGRGG